MTGLSDLIIPDTAGVAIVNAKGHTESFGAAGDQMKFHSAAKPFLVLPFLREDYINPFDLSESERAMLTSSHMGYEIHIETLESVMKKTGIREEQLIVPYSEPLGAAANKQWRGSGLSKRKLFHQCAGNHFSFIIRAKELGVDESCYHLPNSPMQREALSRVEHFIRRANTETTTDNCGVPTCYVNLTEIALAYANLVSTEPYAVDLMRRNAEYVEGDGALATELTRDYPVVAKSSTNVVIAIGHLPSKAGIAVKADSWAELRSLTKAVMKAIQ